MNNDIWKFHDWLIDQKNENKVNENDFNFIIDHIKNNYCPNFENIFVQENIVDAIEDEINEQYLANDNFWSFMMDDQDGLLPGYYYEKLGILIEYFEKIDFLQDDLSDANIKFLYNNINREFASMYKVRNTGIYFTDPPDVKDVSLIIFYNHNEKHMYIFDWYFNGYGLFLNYISAVDFINEFYKRNETQCYTTGLNNVENYLNYLESIKDAFNIT